MRFSLSREVLLKPLAQAIALCLVAGSAEAATAFSSGWFAAKGAAPVAKNNNATRTGWR